jgi:bifunctional DNA-binding transcriptional regulator/antitoxin component of YhaV-PrlF toxin-antitoxin module
MTTILKTTTKGQITIPAKWRKQFNTNQYKATIIENKMVIEPLIFDDNSEITVFDAIRDNKSKGIRAKDLSKLLKKTLK